MRYQRGMLVRLKVTGAIFEIKDVKVNGQIEICHGPSKLIVNCDAVNIVREFHERKETFSNAQVAEQTQ